MNPDIKRQWIEALRSGKYKQATGWLREEAGYCCLGVLCDLHAKAAGNLWGDDEDYFGSWETIPGVVQQWCGLDDADPCVAWNGDDTSLAGANDDGATFGEIADIIDAQL